MSDTETKQVVANEPTEHTKPVEAPEKYTYATLMETSGEEGESWYYFIRYQGNEDNLKHLEDQLESINWRTMDDLNTFVIELQYLVSENTAKEMTKIDMNPTSHHRKFDGVLQRITFPFKEKDKTVKKMTRVFDMLSYGQIEDYIDDEDIDDEDLTDHGSESEESESEESESESPSEEESPRKNRDDSSKKTKIPPALVSSNLPRFAKAKRKQRK